MSDHATQIEAQRLRIEELEAEVERQRDEIEKAWRAEAKQSDEAEELREHIAWTVGRCNAAMGNGFQGTPDSAVTTVYDEIKRLHKVLLSR